MENAHAQSLALSKQMIGEAQEMALIMMVSRLLNVSSLIEPYPRT